MLFGTGFDFKRISFKSSSLLLDIGPNGSNKLKGHIHRHGASSVFAQPHPKKTSCISALSMFGSGIFTQLDWFQNGRRKSKKENLHSEFLSAQTNKQFLYRCKSKKTSCSSEFSMCEVLLACSCKCLGNIFVFSKLCWERSYQLAIHSWVWELLDWHGASIIKLVQGVCLRCNVTQFTLLHLFLIDPCFTIK